MSAPAKTLLWTSALIAAGLLLVVVLREGKPQLAPLPALDMPATPASAAVAQATAGATPEAPPPWMGNAASTTAAASTAARSTPLFEGRQPSREELAQAMAQIREKAEQNDRAADEMLRQLDAAQANGKLPPNINAAALRNNLLIAKRSQALARELGELVSAPDGASTQQRMNAIIAELTRLKGQLRYDVQTAGSTAAISGKAP